MEASRLDAFPIFADLPSGERSILAGAMGEKRIEAGAEVVSHGDFGYAMYAIEDGVADVFVDGDQPAPELGPGDTFGEIGLLVTGRRTATVVARTPMTLLWLFEADFQSVRSRVPEFERAVRRLGGDRLSRD